MIDHRHKAIRVCFELSIMNQVLNVPRNFISQKMDLKNKYKLAIMTTKKLDSWDLSVMIHSQKDEQF